MFWLPNKSITSFHLTLHSEVDTSKYKRLVQPTLGHCTNELHTVSRQSKLLVPHRMSCSVQKESCTTYDNVDFCRKKKSSNNSNNSKNTTPKLSFYSEAYKGKVQISESSFEQASSAEAVYSEVNEVLREEFEKLPKPSEGTRKSPFKMKPWIIVAILMGLLTISLAIITGFLFNEVLNLKKDDEIKYLNQEIQNMKETHQHMINYLELNASDTRAIIEQQRETIIQDINQQRETIIQDIKNNTRAIEQVHHSSVERGVVVQDMIQLLNSTYEEFKNDIMEDVVQLNATKLFRYEYYNFITSFPSCDYIYQSQALRRSGHYWIRSPNGSSVLVYCSITILCNRRGGWRRVVKLEKYENGSATCFPDLVNNRTNASQCVKNGAARGCSHTVFPLHNIEYTHICGVVEGYGYGTPDGFCTGSGIDIFRPRDNDINGNFVDGISLTYQLQAVKKDLWTYSAASGPCLSKSNPPTFLNMSYVSYLPVSAVGNATDATCPTGLTCVDTFHREFPQPISSSIEMRLCRGQPQYDEEIAVGNVEIYVL